MNTQPTPKSSPAMDELLNRQAPPLRVIDFSRCETSADYDAEMAKAERLCNEIAAEAGRQIEALAAMHRTQ